MKRTTGFLLLLILTVGVSVSLFAQQPTLNSSSNTLQILSVTVDGKALPLHHGSEVNLGAFPRNVAFEFGFNTNIQQAPFRIQAKLDGFDNTWKVGSGGGGYMWLELRFFNEAGDQISHTTFPVDGESPGWTGSFESSPFKHCRETFVVPAHASKVWVVITSAGPPATLGTYVVADLTVSKLASNSAPVILLQPSLDKLPGAGANQQVPGWARDGTSLNMAKIVKAGPDLLTTAFAIMDDSIVAHAEWHNIRETAPTVSPGEQLVIEWNEMYSIGLGDFRSVSYPNLPTGNYRFRIISVDIMGRPTGMESSLSVIVDPPVWRQTWFWGLVVITAFVLVFGFSRYALWNRMRREMTLLKNQQALERERLRIAHDIHDGLGALVTQISMVSSRAYDNRNFQDQARDEFDRISKICRELVSALYETVWTVEPENDNLEELGNYLCQIVNQLCERAQFRCRFHVVDLPRGIQVSSQTRHNISMAVQEAVHNVIKHARATEVTITIELTKGLLSITVRDDGCGFNPADNPAGHGLANMKQRLSDIGGTCSIESQPGKGSTVQMNVKFKLSGESHAK